LENVTASDIYEQGVSHLNVGTGEECSIRDLAAKIADTVGYTGNVTFQPNKPDGVLRRIGDNSRINNLGWKHRYGLDEGLGLTYEWYKTHLQK
jgi:GDP-L-fucose synthase